MKTKTHSHHSEKPTVARCFIITVSDTRTPDTDEGGKLVSQLLKKSKHEVAGQKIVKDDSKEIYDAVREALGQGGLDAIFLTGGTGISKRDVTCETVEKIFERKISGFGELFRQLSFEEIGSAAMLSRATAGTAYRKVIFALPGSPNAAQLALEKLILPELPHILSELSK